MASPLANAKLTIPEAAYVAQMSERAINHEIDAKVMRARSSGRGRGRALSGADVVYLKAVRELRDRIAPSLRRQIRDAIATAVARAEPTARVATLEVPVASIEKELSPSFEALARLRQEIEIRPEVLAGEPVIRGTRIAARLVADLLRQGVAPAEIAEEYELAPAQIDAAALFDRVTPKRGRPAAARKLRPARHVPPHR